MIHRFSLFVVLAAVLSAGWAQTSRAAAPLDAQLIKMLLRTGTPAQDTYIDNVVIMTNAGLLPRDVVESSYYWAMRKPKRLRFEYFKHALLFRLNNNNASFDFSTVNAPSALVKPKPDPQNRKRIGGVGGGFFGGTWAPWNWQ